MKIEVVLNEIINRWEAAFPGQIRAWYLIGSQASNTARANSDIDVIFTLDNGFVESAADAVLGKKVSDDLQLRFPDTIPETWGENEWKFTQPELPNKDFAVCLHRVSLKLGSKLIRGEDIRDQISLPKPEDYGLALEHAATGWLKKIQRANDNDNARTGHDPWSRYVQNGNLKFFANWVLSVAACEAYKKSQEFMPTKADFALSFKRWVKGAWMPLVEDVNHLVWRRWECQPPATAAEKAKLSEILSLAMKLEEAIVDGTVHF